MTDLEIGPLDSHRRQVSIGAFLMWMIFAGAGGAIAWDIYGNEIRSRLAIVREGTSTPVVPPPADSNSASTPANDETVALVKDLQASQKRTANQLETAIELLTSEQAASKTTTGAVAALSAEVDRLSAKVDTLQRPTVSVAKKLAPIAPRKPLAAPRSPVVSPEANEPEAPGAPTPLRPPDGLTGAR